VVGVWGNALLLVLNNLVPPFFRWPAGGITRAVRPAAFPGGSDGGDFEQGFQMLPELPTEDWAGFGFGLSLLLLISVPASFLMGRSIKRYSEPGPLIPTKLCRWVLIAPVVCAAGFCMKSGMVTAAGGLIRPYYPLLICRCCWPARRQKHRKSFSPRLCGGRWSAGFLFLALRSVPDKCRRTVLSGRPNHLSKAWRGIPISVRPPAP